MKVFRRRLLVAILVLTGLGHSRAQLPDTLWHTIHSPLSGVQADGRLGRSVAVDGPYAVAGAPLDDTGGLNAGVVKVFDSATGALRFVLPSPNPTTTGFGTSVAISGTRVVVGGGKTFVYDLASGTPTVPLLTFEVAANVVAISGTRIVIGSTTAHVHVYDLASSTPTTPVVILSSPPASAGGFGAAVSISGTRVAVGAWGASSQLFQSGAVYIYDLGSATPTVPLTLNNPEPEVGDLFGFSVAISGLRLVVGAVNEGTGGQYAGSAYVYDLGNVTPTAPVVTLRRPLPASSIQFGYSVAISGTRVVVSVADGAVYLYDMSTGTPAVPLATLTYPRVSAASDFGLAVAIDGTRLAVGTPFADTTAPNTGRVFLYDLSGGAPSTATIAQNDPGLSPLPYGFGTSVALSGNWLVVGAPQDPEGGTYAGSAYVYDLSGVTPTTPFAKLRKPNPTAHDEFGASVAIEGTTVVVGVGKVSYNGSREAAYVYDLTGDPTVAQVALKVPTPAARDDMKCQVAISGTRIVVGTRYPSPSGFATGVHLFDLTRETPSVPVTTILPPAAIYGFATSVDLSGPFMVVGSPQEATGRSFVYDLSSATPTAPVLTLNNPFPLSGDKFGNSVAIFGTRAVVGSYVHDQGRGSAYVYDLASALPNVPAPSLNYPGFRTSNSGFGNQVALSGQRIAILTGYDDERVFVYDVGGNTPTVPVLKLKVSDQAIQFDRSLAFDGATLAIGASGYHPPGGNPVLIYGPAAPDIVVQVQGEARPLVDGGSLSFGERFVQGAAGFSFTVKNTGPLELTSVAASIDGPNVADFTLTSTPAASVAPNGSTVFTVRFSPSSLGPKTATLHIASNDPDESPFDITLSGKGLTPVSRAVDQGSPVELSVEVPAGVSSVQWRKDGVDIPGAVGSTFTLPAVQPWHIGVYSVRVKTGPDSTLSDVTLLGLTNVPTGLWQGLVACYPFDSSVEDLCRPGKPASLVNTSELVTDAQRGGVVQVRGKGYIVPPLDGEPAETRGPGGYLQIPRPPLIDGEPFTISFAIKEEGFSYWHGETLVTLGEDAGSVELLSHYWIGHAAENYGSPSGPIAPHTSDHVVDGSAVTLNHPAWTAYTIAGEGATLRYYRNGQLMGTSAYPKATVGDFFIGRHWWMDTQLLSSTRLVAKVDDLRVYNRALSAPEVQQLYSVVQTTPPAGSFESWVLTNSLTGADATRGADSDRDGSTNWEEFSFGTSPRDGTEPLMKARMVGGTLTLTWLERAGLSYSLKESSDLLPWNTSSIPPSLSADQSSVPAGYVRKQVDIPVPQSSTFAASRFFRVEATQVP